MVLDGTRWRVRGARPTVALGYRWATESVGIYPSLPWWARGLRLAGAFSGIVSVGPNVPGFCARFRSTLLLLQISLSA